MSETDLLKKNRDELISICKVKNIKGYSRLRKDKLIELIKGYREEDVLEEDVIQQGVIELKLEESNSYTFIEVCGGCGGLSSGFIEAGFNPILINEIDKTCCKTLRRNHPGLNIHEGSMIDLDLKPYKGRVDVLQGGVPCQ